MVKSVKKVKDVSTDFLCKHGERGERVGGPWRCRRRPRRMLLSRQPSSQPPSPLCPRPSSSSPTAVLAFVHSRLEELAAAQQWEELEKFVGTGLGARLLWPECRDHLGFTRKPKNVVMCEAILDHYKVRCMLAWPSTQPPLLPLLLRAVCVVATRSPHAS